MREQDEQDDTPKRKGCQCTGYDMPGSCPGPANCPMCQPEEPEAQSCPKCHSQDYNASFHPAGNGLPEAYIWHCEDCFWESEPE